LIEVNVLGSRLVLNKAAFDFKYYFVDSKLKILQVVES